MLPISRARYLAASFFVVVASVLCTPLLVAAEKPASNPAFQINRGDILVQQEKSGDWSAIRILEIDLAPDGSSIAHCLLYQASPVRPQAETIKSHPVRIWHAPIAASSFSAGWEKAGNEPVTQGELAGFFEFLKLTNFPRYLRVTGQDAKAVVAKANEHYERAIVLGKQGRRTEAIREYSSAIEVFPLFYEAIDNRAFTYMEMGDYNEALTGFEQSLRVNPHGLHAFFSKGESLMKLGRLREAENVFAQGVAQFPEQGLLFKKFLARVRNLQKAE